MDFIEQIGQRYVEGKVSAAPQQLENYAKEQFKSSRDKKASTQSRKGSEPSLVDEESEEDHRTLKHTTSKSSKNNDKSKTLSEKDLEIAQLKGELEEARRARGSGSEAYPSTRMERKASRSEESSLHSPNSRKPNKQTSSRPVETRGFKVVGGALVADAASRRHREKRPEHGKSRSLGNTVDKKALGIAGGALVAGRTGRKANSKSEYAAREPIIVEAAPGFRRRVEEAHHSEDEESPERSIAEEEEEEDIRSVRRRQGAHSTRNRRPRRPASESSTPSNNSEEDKYNTTRATSTTHRSTRRSSLASKTSTLSTPPTTTATPRSLLSSTAHPSKSSFSHRPRRPSTESDLGSVFAPAPQIEAIRRRQRSRGRTLADAEIDTAAPETPSLRAMSRRRREEREDDDDDDDDDEEESVRVRVGRGRRGRGHELGVGPAQLPVRSRSVVREALGGEGSVVDVLEVGSVGFRPRRVEGGGRRGGGREDDGRGKGRVGGGMVARRIDLPDWGGRGESEVELVRREGGRSVYRVR